MTKWEVIIDRSSAYIEVEAEDESEAAKKGYEEFLRNAPEFDAWVAEIDEIDEE